MKWNNHSRLVNSHAFLGASQHQWLRYSEDKLKQVYLNRMSVLRGTELHDFAAKAIKLGMKLPYNKDHPKTVNWYINDAIGYKMDPEVVLCYSDNAFGTADAISFKDGMLRIHDLKTGVHPVAKEDENGDIRLEQLEIYAALFCLEYDVDPRDIQIELRIYQNNERIIEIPSAEIIIETMNKIVQFDSLLQEFKKEE